MAMRKFEVDVDGNIVHAFMTFSDVDLTENIGGLVVADEAFHQAFMENFADYRLMFIYGADGRIAQVSPELLQARLAAAGRESWELGEADLTLAVQPSPFAVAEDKYQTKNVARRE